MAMHSGAEPSLCPVTFSTVSGDTFARTAVLLTTGFFAAGLDALVVVFFAVEVVDFF